MTGRTVVVGGGVAGAATATTLRELAPDRSVLLVGAEPHLPYERPALSKGYLAGTARPDDLLVHPAGTYADLGVEVRCGVSAVGLDTGARRVLLSDGATAAYDDLVVATGSVNRDLPVPGRELAGVHALRTLDDADRLLAGSAGAREVVCVGLGFIGCEVAATLRGRGLAVTLVGPEPGPLWGPLGPQVSRRVRSWHDEHGVRLRTGADVVAVDGDGAVEQVRLGDGRVLAADLVVVGVGARPSTDWLLGSGVQLGPDGAVLVDADGRSGAAGVHAVGDVAARWDETARAHVRVEHEDAARVSGRRVAHALLGLPAPAAGPQWFWSDQYDHTLQYGGRHGPADELHWRGGSTGFFVRDGRITAVVSIDDGRQFRRGLALVGGAADLPRLLDEAVDLRSLRPSAVPTG